MAGLTFLHALVAALLAVTSAMPAAPRLTDRQLKIHSLMERQSAAEKALAITDFDVLQFALTLEWLETTFYQQGFAAIPEQQFLDLGLSQRQVQDLLAVGKSEETHVITLQGALAQSGIKPVLPCTYNFGNAFSSAQAMVQTAAVLEQVGVSAYLGAAPILSDASILSTAASIFSVEARHQSFIRAASQVAAAPNAFDTPLSPRQVFSLAAPFISSCPDGSNLALTAFPAITMANSDPAAVAQVSAAVADGPQTLALQSEASSQAAACAFSVGDLPLGSTFTPFTNGACTTPQGLTGVVYLSLVSAVPASGKITDDIIVAGPMVLQVT